ncbi:unnamed protein product [Acanthoscelides obtectus]|uniref:Uncharacterized protein n=1 Tax=Acanthoscelides obtectus TaxID=200917 RepID=A0A9P0KCA5_ACAOB|nr:unnamed protein product [Acanthoscelides obtectus]CAK1651740.1 hypothetical protein AOBTE_LOCUS17426 [Acanthoscelides obtectus]
MDQREKLNPNEEGQNLDPLLEEQPTEIGDLWPSPPSQQGEESLSGASEDELTPANMSREMTPLSVTSEQERELLNPSPKPEVADCKAKKPWERFPGAKRRRLTALLKSGIAYEATLAKIQRESARDTWEHLHHPTQLVAAGRNREGVKSFPLLAAESGPVRKVALPNRHRKSREVLGRLQHMERLREALGGGNSKATSQKTGKLYKMPSDYKKRLTEQVAKYMILQQKK